MRKSILVAVTVASLTIGTVFADCPSADLTGDCFVDFQDLAVLANQ